MNTRIHIDTWLELKPYTSYNNDDLFYLNLSNEVKKVIVTSRHNQQFVDLVDKEDIDLLCCFLCAYLEDLASETNIWNTFVRIHQRMYQRPLPFYNLDDYYEEEFNPQDISFLIWYFLDQRVEGKLITPTNPFITETADEIMELFDQAWGDAPVNIKLKTYYHLDEEEKDYYEARNLMDILLFQSYLFYPDTTMRMLNMEIETIEEHKSEPHVLELLKENRDDLLHSAYSALLALKSNDWTAELLGDEHSASKYFRNIKKRISGHFLYKGQDDKNLFLEHIASGRKFNLTKKSFEITPIFKEVDTLIIISIVYWNEEWWFSGILTTHRFDADLVLDLRNDIAARMTVSFLDHEERGADEILQKQLKIFKEYNKGSQIAFMPSSKLNSFLQGFMKFNSESLNLSEKERKAARERANKEGLFDFEQSKINIEGFEKTVVVFFNPKSGIEFAMGVNSAFPLPNNPYFNESQCNQDLMFLIASDEISTELVLYCIAHCKNDLPFFNENTGKFFLENIDFLLRYWKKKNYHAKPNFSFVG